MQFNYAVEVQIYPIATEFVCIETAHVANINTFLKVIGAYVSF